MSQEEIGDAVGLTRGTVNRVLNDFERSGLIKRSGASIAIVRLDLLRSLASAGPGSD